MYLFHLLLIASALFTTPVCSGCVPAFWLAECNGCVMCDALWVSGICMQASFNSEYYMNDEPDNKAMQGYCWTVSLCCWVMLIADTCRTAKSRRTQFKHNVLYLSMLKSKPKKEWRLNKAAFGVCQHQCATVCVCVCVSEVNLCVCALLPWQLDLPHTNILGWLT